MEKEQEYREVKIVRAKRPSSYIADVKLLETLLETKVTATHEERTLIVKLGLNCFSRSREEYVTGIEQVSGQTSLDCSLNPSDFYYQPISHWEEGAGHQNLVQMNLTFGVGQRRASEIGTPWYPYWKRHCVRHFSFKAEMLGGFNRWSMYRLDYDDLENVRFDFVKTFSYVQGEVIDA